MQDNTPHILDFGEPEKENSIIKVIGVGGGVPYRLGAWPKIELLTLHN